MHELELIEGSLMDGGLSDRQSQWLCSAIKRWRHGLPIERAFQLDSATHKVQRDAIIRDYVMTLDATWCLNQKARHILQEKSRLESGRQCSPMIAAAHWIKPIPNSVRQILRIFQA